MTTDQLLAVLATLLAGAAMLAWPFVTSSARTSAHADRPSEDPVALVPTVVTPVDRVVRCEVVLVEALSSPAGHALRAGRFVIEAAPTRPTALRR